MNRPVRRTSIVSVNLPASAVEDLSARVSTGEFASLDDAVTAALLELEHFRAVALLGGEAAFRDLAKEVEVETSAGVGEVDAFEFLHVLKLRYEEMAEAEDDQA